MPNSLTILPCQISRAQMLVLRLGRSVLFGFETDAAALAGSERTFLVYLTKASDTFVAEVFQAIKKNQPCDTFRYQSFFSCQRCVGIAWTVKSQNRLLMNVRLDLDGQVAIEYDEHDIFTTLPFNLKAEDFPELSVTDSGRIVIIKDAQSSEPFEYIQLCRDNLVFGKLANGEFGVYDMTYMRFERLSKPEFLRAVEIIRRSQHYLQKFEHLLNKRAESTPSLKLRRVSRYR